MIPLHHSCTQMNWWLASAQVFVMVGRNSMLNRISDLRRPEALILNVLRTTLDWFVNVRCFLKECTNFGASFSLGIGE
jgi:hypothetical protein